MSILKLYAEDGHFKRVPAEQLFEEKKNWFIGWKCLAGSESLVIDREGAVFSASCKSRGTLGRQGSYGNVFHEFQAEKAPINCARRFCETEFDMGIPKYHRPKFQAVMNREAGAVEKIEATVAIRGEHDFYKKIHWNMGTFENRKLVDWKNAVHRLETFLKGDVCRFYLEDPPVFSPAFFAFLRFLIEEKGHLIVVEGDLNAAPEFFVKILQLADVRLRLEENEASFFSSLERIKEPFQELQRQRIFRKIQVLLDVKNPEYGRLRAKLLSDPYRSWLEPGYYLGKFILPRPQAVVTERKQVSAIQRVSATGSKILLFIPMRNCAKTIGKVLSRVDQELVQYIDEILVLDNASTDGSLEIAQAAAEEIKDVKIVVRRNDTNYGLGGSHKLAFKYAFHMDADYVFVVHGDDSGSPQEFLPLLRSKEFTKYDALLSDRLSFSSKRTGYPLYRLLSNWMLNLLASIVTLSSVRDFSGGPLNLYRVRTFMNKFENPVKQFNDRISFAQDALLFVKYKRGLVCFVPVSYREAGGKTFYSAVTQFARSVAQLLSWPVRKKFS